ncbi:glycoside hydrolase family 3 C-terminal domain-containing protein [Parasediminibacterium sp. JCM 36343]|uniref:glycoside hydrolase family 3 C-terminal domain-containing protein n=1 Tax=Parasediminibacterium sp. JCM 36343 TaxID=3374279 RepID=UPI00397C9973
MKKQLLVGIVSIVGFISVAKAQTSSQNEEKINALIKKMIIEEKVRMIHANSSFTSAGVPRLGIPELVTSDGPHGVRLEHGRGWGELKDVNDSGTYLPVGVALASTWNPSLGFEFGKVLGSEAKYRGKNVILGPGINIMRSPLNGRNFEYQSEDPYLVSKMVVGYIKGVQSQGTSACVKHFMANNEEVDRGTVDVQMSERALREIYLPGFKAAVMEGDVNTIMGAYNKFRGQFCTHNEYLVNKIMKGEWGFKGVLMSDWGAVHNTMEALYNGTDLEMGSDIGTPRMSFPNFYLGDTVVALVKSGKMPESIVDEKVRRILRVMFKTEVFSKTSPGEYGSAAHIATAKKVAEESIVLLKNEAHILPLSLATTKSIAIIGANATRKNSMGGGSSQVKALYEITPLAGLKSIAKDIVFNYAEGYTIARNATPTTAMINDAVEAAKKSDVAIVVGGWAHGYNYAVWDDNAFDAEGVDKPDMKMPFGQDELIKAVVKANPNTIVVLIGGGPIDMTQWVGNTKGIIEAWYGGMEGGTALAEVIFGKINPSGKLPVTFPKVLEDVPAHKMGDFPGKNGVAVYREGIFVGYRYYDTYKVEPQFAFGHGLSYTDFAYKNLKVAKDAAGLVTATFTITNTGKVYGGEVTQLYVHKNKTAIARAEKELKGFQKVFLQPGETKTVTIQLRKDAFQYYDEDKNAWATEKGDYTIEVGGSSKSIVVSGGVSL